MASSCVFSLLCAPSGAPRAAEVKQADSTTKRITSVERLNLFSGAAIVTITTSALSPKKSKRSRTCLLYTSDAADDM
eukprot:8090856-Alexandrium_andersonii.AAC.1